MEMLQEVVTGRRSYLTEKHSAWTAVRVLRTRGKLARLWHWWLSQGAISTMDTDTTLLSQCRQALQAFWQALKKQPLRNACYRLTGNRVPIGLTGMACPAETTACQLQELPTSVQEPTASKSLLSLGRHGRAADT